MEQEQKEYATRIFEQGGRLCVQLGWPQFAHLISPKRPEVPNIVVGIPMSEGLGWTLTEELAEYIAKPGCKACYGRGIDGYTPGSKDTSVPSMPLLCTKNKCTQKNFDTLKVIAVNYAKKHMKIEEDKAVKALEAHPSIIAPPHLQPSEVPQKEEEKDAS